MSTNAIPFPESEPSVRAVDDAVVFDGFVERDPDVIHVLSDADDIDHAAHTVLQIGARAVRVANATTDTNVVEKSFARLADSFDEKMQENFQRVAQVNDELFKDGGQVGQLLATFHEGLDAALGETFDPDSKKSVIAKVEKVVVDVAKAQQLALQRLVDPSEDQSPLRKIQRDLAEVVKETGESLAKQVRELSERIAVEEKAAEVLNLTTLKGVSFEDLVHAALSELAAALGDVAEKCGAEVGFAGTKKGDEIVGLNQEDTGGTPCRVVFEVKDRKLSQANVNSELDAAMANRDAAAAILVFADQAQAPTAAPFCYSGNHATVVFDKHDPDVRLLRLAYLWGRWIARRSLAGATTEALDVEKVTGIFDRIGTALQKAKLVRRGHTQSVNALKLAGTHLDALEQEVTDALDELRDELGA